ncbi:DUF4132 domain-containing protein [Hymenobacter cellulosivorans]|uniref:DUF4132 domain-containing protein n=1 Tax=Hymenobacter cellulosivorans TaxID=2932249 RepID=A0ABY4FFC0_9BACT|nr:DUF4132 domain-containing protein [Hymenobacter cellulosivorans]UOQ55388.1 DUF4132 domain-containing protein [Hymenobacter cellulosivorans]
MASIPETAPTPPEVVEMQPVIEAYLREIKERKLSYYKLTDLATYQELKDRDAAYKGRLVLAVAAQMRRPEGSYSFDYDLDMLLKVLVRSTLELTNADYVRLLHLYGLKLEGANINGIANAMALFPVLPTLAQLEKQAKKQPLEAEILDYLRQLLAIMAVNSTDTGLMKLRVKVQELLGQNGENHLPTVIFSDNDAFGQALNAFVAQLPPATAQPWLRLLQLWQKTSGAQPTAKFKKEAEAAIAAIGQATVAAQYSVWLTCLSQLPVQTYSYDNDPSTYSNSYLLTGPNLNPAKGLVWTSALVLMPAMYSVLEDLALKCYRKVPGQGQIASSLGNACVLALAQGGLPGVGHLSRLKLKVKQSNTQALIQGYLEKAALELGVTPAEIEDMAVPTLGLTQGRAEYHYGDYQARLQLVEGKAEVQWHKDGKELKSVPAALKKTHAAELKELKETQTQVQQNLTAQRERLDRSFVEGRRLPLAWFQQYYFEHELLSYLVRPLIWRFHHPDGSHTDALWLDEAWHNAQGQPVAAPGAETQVQLWHPVLVSMTEVLAWRQLLDARQLRQPLKQAYRELYLLTPPEERTGTYSNRMAAHILRQHQFNSLTKLRGWRYRLMGAYDKGYESDSATLELPAYGLQAQFWVSEVNADDAWNDAGIWNYVSTDQVRFVTGHGTVPLPEVPPLVFSEVMRDVDLFVGVASVGNDPQWRDNGGLPAYRNYWESYSFGELGEVAKNRKLALERLVPRMKIGKVSEIQDRFLVVRGKLRTYKIHLGSGNILMEPNDQYLCIVPDRSAKAPSAADVFLPFEGDAVLSIILSKALLLMDDDKITDETINRQIKR